MEHINNLESGCSAHDPTEDTESEREATRSQSLCKVAAPTIRLRILKDQRPGASDPELDCCSAHDPTEDTESYAYTVTRNLDGSLQRPRSD